MMYESTQGKLLLVSSLAIIFIVGGMATLLDNFYEGCSKVLSGTETA